jgi:uncharacterized membrane protein
MKEPSSDAILPKDNPSPRGTQEMAPQPSTGHPPEQERLVRQAELVISHVLRGGVLLSAAITLLGVLLFYLRFGPSGGHEAGAAFPHTLGGVVSGLAHGDALAIIVLGLLVLLATPVVRVAVSIIAFGLERDWRYVAITSLVLLILLLSFALGRGGA